MKSCSDLTEINFAILLEFVYFFLSSVSPDEVIICPFASMKRGLVCFDTDTSSSIKLSVVHTTCTCTWRENRIKSMPMKYGMCSVYRKFPRIRIILLNQILIYFSLLWSKLLQADWLILVRKMMGGWLGTLKCSFDERWCSWPQLNAEL